jgi:hypothetical protein
VKDNRRSRRVKVSADGTGLVSRAGVVLLRELTVDIGLAAGWTQALLDTYKSLPTMHAPGRVLADMAVVIADGGDALAHLATLRDQGKVARPARKAVRCGADDDDDDDDDVRAQARRARCGASSRQDDSARDRCTTR